MAVRAHGSKPKTKFAAKNEIWCLLLTAHSGRARHRWHLSGWVAGANVCVRVWVRSPRSRRQIGAPARVRSAARGSTSGGARFWL
eukprot:236052-Rhodomonas_salina.1